MEFNHLGECVILITYIQRFEANIKMTQPLAGIDKTRSGKNLCNRFDLSSVRDMF